MLPGTQGQGEEGAGTVTDRDFKDQMFAVSVRGTIWSHAEIERAARRYIARLWSGTSYKDLALAEVKDVLADERFLYLHRGSIPAVWTRAIEEEALERVRERKT